MGTVDAREERGRQLASVAQIRRVGRRWAVPPQTRASERYLVDVEGAACTCPDYEERRGTCKHQHAVMFWIAWGRDVGADGSVTETITLKRKTYAQPCWRSYNASQVHEREYVERLLRALCAGIQQPPRKPGPGRKPLPIADIVFAVILKVFMTLSSRRAQSDLRESAARGNLETVGHFNALTRFLADPASTPLLTCLVETSAAPLCAIENGQYAIDSSGFSTVTYDRWFDQKHGKLRAAHPWVKLHVMCGTATHAITSARVTSEGDCPQLPTLLARTRVHHDVRELSADKAYSSIENHDVLESFGVEAAGRDRAAGDQGRAAGRDRAAGDQGRDRTAGDQGRARALGRSVAGALGRLRASSACRARTPHQCGLRVDVDADLGDR